jgi:3-oxoacyl-[acyl-carrier protein] reductase
VNSKSRGVRAAAFQADQGDAAQGDGLVKAVVKRFGRLDILVNNAGVFVTGALNDQSNDVAKFDRQFAGEPRPAG